MRKELNKYQERLTLLEEEKKNKDQQFLYKTSETEKDIALMTQKIQLQEQAAEQMQKKEKQLTEELTISKKNDTQKVKELTNKYESELSSNQGEITFLKDRVTELQRELEKADSMHLGIQKNLESKMNQLNSKLHDYEIDKENMEKNGKGGVMLDKMDQDSLSELKITWQIQYINSKIFNQ